MRLGIQLLCMLVLSLILIPVGTEVLVGAPGDCLPWIDRVVDAGLPDVQIHHSPRRIELIT